MGSGSGRGNDLGDLERDELEIILRLCVLGEHTSHYFMAHGGLGRGKGIIMPPALRGEQQRWMYVGRRKGKRACMVVVSFGRRPQERKSEGNGASAPPRSVPEDDLIRARERDLLGGRPPQARRSVEVMMAAIISIIPSPASL